MSAMEEWQRRMRAEKEAERKKKTESAQMLRGYRGVDEEALKLKKTREEERQKHLDAQTNLHNFRAKELQVANNSGKEKLVRQQQEHLPLPVNAGGSILDPMAGIEFGSVSEKATALAAAEKAALKKAALENEHATTTSAEVVATSYLDTKTEEGFTPDAVAAQVTSPVNTAPIGSSVEESMNGTMKEASGEDSKPASTTVDVAEPTLNGTTAETEVTPPLVVETAPETAPATTESVPMVQPEPMTVVLSQADTIVTSNTDPSPVAATEVQAVPEPESIAISTDASPVAAAVAKPVAEPTVEAGTTPTTARATAAVPAVSVRVHVLFSFGIVTMHNEPDLSSYMQAVDTVVGRSMLQGNGIHYQPDKNFPFVKTTAWDDSYISRSSRGDVKRMVVTAAVPVIIDPSATRRTAKRIIVDALQASIRDGEFLSLAQSQ